MIPEPHTVTVRVEENRVWGYSDYARIVEVYLHGYGDELRKLPYSCIRFLKACFPTVSKCMSLCVPF